MLRAAILLIMSGACATAQDDPLTAIPPLVEAGKASYLRGDYEAARNTFEQAWQLAQQTPAAAPIRYDVLKQMASVRAATGEFTDADDYLQMAINWREINLGQDDPKIADDLLQSVGLCRAMKAYDRALAILGRVMGMHRNALGPASTALADDYSRAALIQLDQKKRAPAVTALTTALGIRTKLIGPLDPSLIPDLDRLGEAFVELRAYEEAEEAYRHALVIRETLYGRENADLIATVDGLAYSLLGQKKYAEAEPMYQRLLGLWTASVGNHHPMVAIALDKVAVFYEDQKKLDQSRDALSRSNAIREHFLAVGLGQQAAVELEAGNKAAAKELYQRALKVLEAPNPIHEELRGEIEGLLKAIETPTAKKKK